jgi:23S rRNA pseudouridine2605 synthase
MVMQKRAFKHSDSKGQDTVRLNKFIAASGLCSRREADQLIADGKVKVDGKVIQDLGTKILPNSKVMVDGQPVQGERKIYILMNKPKNIITTTSDPEGRKTVTDLIGTAVQERVYPVGRLDRNTTGILLLTNDGDLAEKLTHPRFGVEKIYEVGLNRGLQDEDIQKLKDGIELEDGPFSIDKISFPIPGNKSVLGVSIHSGRNRIIRRTFEHLGYEVVKLDRVSFAGLNKKSLTRGRWRKLSPKEISWLKMKSKK